MHNFHEHNATDAAIGAIKIAHQTKPDSVIFSVGSHEDRDIDTL